MLKATFPIFVALAGFVALPAEASPGKEASVTLDTVLAKHFDAQGGLARLKAIKSISYTGTDQFDGKSSTMTATRMRPNMFRYENSDGTTTKVKAFDGTAGWWSEDGNVQAVAADKLEGMKAKAAFDDVLLDPAGRGAKVELAGKEEVSGAPAYVVRIKHASGNEEHRYIDARSGLEVKRTVAWSYEGKSGTKTVTFRDYRPVNGVMTAFVHEFEKDGKRGTFTINKLEIDGGVSIASFQMPRATPKTAASKALPASTK